MIILYHGQIVPSIQSLIRDQGLSAKLSLTSLLAMPGEQQLSLSAFFTPNVVAVIGASTNPTKLGHTVVQNLVECGFLNDHRKIFPINHNAETILGLKSYPSILDVPEPVDLAIVVIPYPAVPEAIRLCGEKGV